MSRSIPVRRLTFDFSEVPRDWCGGDSVLTCLLDGLCVIFPEGERMFVRSVRAFEDRIDDPELLDRIRGFYGQEANHGRAHRETIDVIEAHGYHIRDWVDWYEDLAYGRLERMTPAILRLSTTVALEHLTATLAEIAFDDDDLVATAHPVMASLLKWHAAEEIEHKSVAFDVLRAVDPRLRIRVLGFLIGTLSFAFFEMSATRHLTKQIGRSRGSRRTVLRELIRRPNVRRQLLDYLRRDFHPDQRDNGEMARTYLEAIGRLAG